MAVKNKHTAPLNIAWKAHPGPQTRFVSSTAFELMYGGAAGGGKSDGLLAAALRHVHNPDYRAILFRRTHPDLVKSLIDRSTALYPILGAKFQQQDSYWRFPSGARVYLSHMQYESDVYAHRSVQYQYVGFDELTTFSQTQYVYMISRMRSAQGIPVRIRSATNPGGEFAEWVLRRWAPWLVPLDRWESEGITGWEKPIYAADGQLLNIVQVDDDREGVVALGHPDGLTRVFVPAKLSDNPALTINDPNYRKRLMALDSVSRMQLLGGLWLVKVAAGMMFKKDWFRSERLPENGTYGLIRYWDRAATEPNKNNPDPDWTVGMLVAREQTSGVFYVLGVERFRARPAEVIRRIVETAEKDKLRYGHVTTGLEQEPGASGVFEIASYVTALAGFAIHIFKPAGTEGSKVIRAKPASAQAEHGMVRVCEPGLWWGPVVSELEAFPEGGHDDCVDAFSGAVTALCSFPAAEYVKVASMFENLVVSSRAKVIRGLYDSDDDGGIRR